MHEFQPQRNNPPMDLGWDTAAEYPEDGLEVYHISNQMKGSLIFFSNLVLSHLSQKHINWKSGV